MEAVVSIVMPTFNRADLIIETLKSISAQTFKQWECLIIDDGSTDGSEEIISAFIQNDLRFRFLNRPSECPKGGNSCRNYGFSLAKGKYLKFFDSDDLMHPDFLKTQVSLMESKPHLDFCAAMAKVFHNTADDLEEFLIPKITASRQIIHDFIIGRIFFLTPSPLWRKEFLDGKALFDEKLFRSQEADFHFRRITEKPEFEYIAEVLFYVRRGHQSIDSTALNNIVSIRSQFDYFQKVFDYLDQNTDMPDAASLKQYILYRQTSILMFVNRLKNRSALIGVGSQLKRNLRKAELDFFDRLKMLIGVNSMIFCGRGYGFLHNKKFDLRLHND